MKANISCLMLLCLPIFIFGQSDSLQSGISDTELLKLFDGLRVADVSDGMDMVGLPDIGLMDQKIEALWKDIEDLSHIFCGIAITATIYSYQ